MTISIKLAQSHISMNTLAMIQRLMVEQFELKIEDLTADLRLGSRCVFSKSKDAIHKFVKCRIP